MAQGLEDSLNRVVFGQGDAVRMVVWMELDGDWSSLNATVDQPACCPGRR